MDSMEPKSLYVEFDVILYQPYIRKKSQEKRRYTFEIATSKIIWHHRENDRFHDDVKKLPPEASVCSVLLFYRLCKNYIHKNLIE